jgi:peptide/nickel transport system substrate-binding protein
MLAVVAALACAGGAARAESRAAYGGTVVAPLGSVAMTIDPARAVRPGELTLVALVFDAPFAVDAGGRVVPRLAASLEGAESGRARLTIKPGLRFHDGQAVTAQDVAASLNRANSQGNPAGWWLAPVRAAKAVGEDAVEIELLRPAPDLAALLAAPAAAVTPGGQAPAQKVIVTGPFRFVGWDKKVVRLAASPLCAEGRPYLDALSLKAFASRAEEAGSYEVGSSQVSLHGATAFEGGTPKHRTAVVDGPRATTVALAFGKGFFDPQAARPPAAALALRGGLPDDVGLRRAIAAVIDRERLRRMAVRDPAAAVAPFGARMDGARGRAELARFTAAGRIKASLLIDGTRYDDRDVADKLLAELADVGIDVTVDAMDPKGFQERIEGSRYDLALVEAGGGPDPGLSALALVAAVDPRLARALLARGPADAQAVERAVAERMIYTPLYQRSVRAHHRADLLGLAIDAAGRVDYAAAHWVK